MTYWYPGPQRVIEILREVFPKIPVILGGIYATLLPEHARSTLKPDFVITGAGEVQIENLLSELLPAAPRNSLTFRSLDDFPTPAFDLYCRLDYLPVMTSRGCPYHCTFCATDKISGPYAQRHPRAVVREILDNIRRFGISDIAFYDDALLLNKNQRLIPILEALVAEGVKLRFHTPNGLHARQIDQEMAKWFRLSGFTTIRLSFETADSKRLADMKNKVTPADLSEAVKNLEQAGYSRKQLEAYVMMGLPHQSFQEICDSLIFVHSLGIKIRLASFSPIPGTIDHDRAVKDGLFPAEADPLLTNKTIFPLFRTTAAYEQFQRIRQLVRAMNESVEQGSRRYGSEEIKNAFQTITGTF
ncbi:MAG: B12-binding domain-containing radical SAM protein, partial [Bacteroidales bacterium]|nr:B12-binding domain-containing radical SAM protein [Bacteroidales bacterium]